MYMNYWFFMSLKPRQYKQVYECKTRQMYRHRQTTHRHRGSTPSKFRTKIKQIFTGTNNMKTFKILLKAQLQKELFTLKSFC